MGMWVMSGMVVGVVWVMVGVIARVGLEPGGDVGRAGEVEAHCDLRGRRGGCRRGLEFVG